MAPDPSHLITRIRHLSRALMISGTLNIGVLAMMLYWMLKERLPTPYCELKPASIEQQQIPLADRRGFTEVLSHLSQLSFSQLVSRLSQTQLIENGYAERDLALACLIAFHHFDIERALPKNVQPQQKRLLAWKANGQNSSITLVVYPDLTEQQFDSVIHFAKTELWPLTAEGLFLVLQEQNKKKNLHQDLMDTFFLTPEFWTVELLFSRSGHLPNKQEILSLLLEGNWMILKQFVDQQRQVHDLSDARRQKFLLDYLKGGSKSAAVLLLKGEWDFSVKKLDDQQVIAILALMPGQLPECIRFAKEMLMSPRSANVWQEASGWLFAQAGEPIPKQLNYLAALARFAPEKPIIELVSKPSVLPASPINPLLLSSTKETITVPIKSISSPKSKPTSPCSSIKTTSLPLVKMGSVAKKSVAPTQSSSIYIVKEGDTLWKISRFFGINVEELKLRNSLKSDVLKPGTILKIH
jgi:LysM repeat protein